MATAVFRSTSLWRHLRFSGQPSPGDCSHSLMPRAAARSGSVWKRKSCTWLTAKAAFICMCVYVYVYVCVCEGEREKEEREHNL